MLSSVHDGVVPFAQLAPNAVQVRERVATADWALITHTPHNDESQETRRRTDADTDTSEINITKGQ